MKRMMRGLAAGAALVLASVSGGCASAYGWDGYDGWGGSSEMRGVVNDVHERYRVIRLRRDNGRITDVRYDARTEVVYQGRRYRPESLDRGDYVSVRVNRDSRGQLYARNVTLRRDARDGYNRDRDRRDNDGWDDRRDRDRRDDGWGNVRSLDGRVGRVDRSRRRFELRSDRGTVWVSLPYNADRTVRDRFSRLRSGDRVQVSGRYAGNGRFQMDGFR
jgi:hypothetical protein